MTLRQVLIYVALPLSTLPVYFATISVMSHASRKSWLSEMGPIELGTAAAFLAAAGVAIALVVGRRAVPGRYRTLYALFALGAMFVALEEMSYGQHLLGWDSPAWFNAHNRQGETNLHNLADSKPSRRIRTLANIGFPLVMVVLPLAALARRASYEPGRPAYYLLPKAELCTLTLMAVFVTSIDAGWEYRIAKLGELKEFYWAAAALIYIIVLRRRLSEQTEERFVAKDQSILPFQGHMENVPIEKRAA